MSAEPLFAPDDLSRLRPELGRVDESERRAVAALFASRYHRLGELDEILVVSSRNPVTRNFVVRSAGQRHVLKRRAGAHAQAALAREAALADALAARQVPVPLTLRADDGAPAVEWDGAAWALNVFHDGDPFTGRGDEVEAAARGLARLVVAARGLPVALFGAPSEGAAWLEELEALTVEACSHGDAVTRDLLVSEQSGLAAATAAVRAARPAIESAVAPLHLDYHPLNLLMRDEALVCVLDLEDVAMGAVLAGVGFAAYKLLRRRAVDAPAELPALPGRWTAAFRAEAPQMGWSAAELAAGARYRVLALVRLILDRHLRRGDSSLLYDLSKQLRSLREIEALFEGSVP